MDTEAHRCRHTIWSRSTLSTRWWWCHSNRSIYCSTAVNLFESRSLLVYDAQSCPHHTAESTLLLESNQEIDWIRSYCFENTCFEWACSENNVYRLINGFKSPINDMIFTFFFYNYLITVATVRHRSIYYLPHFHCVQTSMLEIYFLTVHKVVINLQSRYLLSVLLSPNS